MFQKHILFSENFNYSVNKETENRTDTHCIPYVRAAYDRLKKQLARHGVNVIFKKRQALGKKLIINSRPPKSDRKKNVVYKIPCASCDFCYIGETSQWFDEREKQTQSLHKELQLK